MAPVSDSDVVTLKQLGISKRKSSDWQWMARLPEEVVEAIIADCHKSGRRLSTNLLVRVSKTLHGVDPRPEDPLAAARRALQRLTPDQRAELLAELGDWLGCRG